MSNQPPSPFLLAFALCMLALTLLLEIGEPEPPVTQPANPIEFPCIADEPDGVTFVDLESSTETTEFTVTCITETPEPSE